MTGPGAPPATRVPDGYHTVPPGKLVSAVTWLDMRAPPTTALADPLWLRPVAESDRQVCRALYVAIGTPWLWSRAFAPPDAAADDADTHFAMDEAGDRVGLVAFTDRDGPEVAISYFGLVPAAIGHGLGRRMMAAALDLAWRGADRVWLHTCSFDHPAALRFYLACGFTPYATGFEILDDPRLAGLLPRDAAPHVPLITPPR